MKNPLLWLIGGGIALAYLTRKKEATNKGASGAPGATSLASDKGNAWLKLLGLEKQTEPTNTGVVPPASVIKIPANTPAPPPPAPRTLLEQPLSVRLNLFAQKIAELRAIASDMFPDNPADAVMTRAQFESIFQGVQTAHGFRLENSDAILTGFDGRGQNSVPTPVGGFPSYLVAQDLSTRKFYHLKSQAELDALLPEWFKSHFPR